MAKDADDVRRKGAAAGRALVALFVGALLLAAAAPVAVAAVERGTDGFDRIVGTDGPDRLYGRGGSDQLNGKADKDLLSGGDGTDALRGGPGADDLRGGDGGDYLSDGKFFSDGPSGERSRDTLSGGGGDDVFFTANRPAAKDIVRCGPGRDTVEADRADTVSSGCEEVNRR